MDKKIKIGIGLLLAVIVFSSFKKPSKGGSKIIVEDYETDKSADADFLVFIKKGSVITSLKDGKEITLESDVKYDGFNTNELPSKIKVRDGLGKYFYAYAPDFKVL